MHTLQFLLQGVEYQGRRYKLGVELKTDFVCYLNRGSIEDAGVTVIAWMGLSHCLSFDLQQLITDLQYLQYISIIVQCNVQSGYTLG